MLFSAENVKAKYADKIIACLESLREEFRGLGFEVTNIDDWSDEEYAWQFSASVKSNKDKTIGVDLYITEEKVREGEGYGFAFHLSIIGIGDEILGNYSPYNYTPQLWCRNWTDLDARMEMLSGITLGEDTVSSIIEYAGL
ncbi:MAG TPA: hypothetical protein VFR24_00135 [Candidatus Angelobacter sp.]|nr:hypothetical protein [Candidatus Angelobacter sp.]